MRRPIVLVEWGDAFIDCSDISFKKAKKLKAVKRRTVGFYMGKNKDGDIILCTDIYDKKSDGDGAAPMLIPMGMVREWYELELL